jgi:peptidoglycan/LPS O-acetylase OafA/YrhL
LPGLIFAALFAVGLAGLFVRRRSAAVPGLLWVSAVAVLVLPIAENQYNYRYALAAVPLVSMAAALSVAERRGMPLEQSRARDLRDGVTDGAPRTAE